MTKGVEVHEEFLKNVFTSFFIHKNLNLNEKFGMDRGSRKTK